MEFYTASAQETEQLGQRRSPALLTLSCSGDRGDLGVKDPVDKLVLILEMIIKGVAAHFAVPGNITHGDVCKGSRLQKLLQASGNHKLCEVRG